MFCVEKTSLKTFKHSTHKIIFIDIDIDNLIIIIVLVVMVVVNTVVVLVITNLSIIDVIERNVAFLAGSIFAVLTLLTILDKDVLFAEHVLTVIAGLGKLMVTKEHNFSFMVFVVLKFF